MACFNFNGTIFFKQGKVQSEIELDSSLHDFGAIFNNKVYVIVLPSGYMNFGMVHLEMLNILVAHHTWGDKWAGKAILVHCDNQALVFVIQSGRTRDLTLAA